MISKALKDCYLTAASKRAEATAQFDFLHNLVTTYGEGVFGFRNLVFELEKMGVVERPVGRDLQKIQEFENNIVSIVNSLPGIVQTADTRLWRVIK